MYLGWKSIICETTFKFIYDGRIIVESDDDERLRHKCSFVLSSSFGDAFEYLMISFVVSFFLLASFRYKGLRLRVNRLSERLQRFRGCGLFHQVVLYFFFDLGVLFCLSLGVSFLLIVVQVCIIAFSDFARLWPLHKRLVEYL